MRYKDAKIYELKENEIWLTDAASLCDLDPSNLKRHIIGFVSCRLELTCSNSIYQSVARTCYKNVLILSQFESWFALFKNEEDNKWKRVPRRAIARRAQK